MASILERISVGRALHRVNRFSHRGNRVSQVSEQVLAYKRPLLLLIEVITIATLLDWNWNPFRASEFVQLVLK